MYHDAVIYGIDGYYISLPAESHGAVITFPVIALPIFPALKLIRLFDGELIV